MSAKTRISFWLAICLLVLFIAVITTHNANPLVHQTAGIVMFTVVTIHVILHWKWIKTVIKRRFLPVPRQTKVNFVYDTFLLCALTLTASSGLAISPTFRSGDAPDTLITLHHASAEMLSFGIAIHLILHRKWILHTIKQYLTDLIPAPSKSV